MKTKWGGDFVKPSAADERSWTCFVFIMVKFRGWGVARRSRLGTCEELATQVREGWPHSHSFPLKALPQESRDRGGSGCHWPQPEGNLKGTCLEFLRQGRGRRDLKIREQQGGPDYPR